MLDEEGITQRELARRSGLSEQSVGRWVNGDSNPDVTRAIKLFNALGYRVLLVKDEDVKKICN
jgi:transcriptional regulator with XRE-family HTH domain